MRVTKSAPGGPRNSNSVVRGLSLLFIDLEGDMVVVPDERGREKLPFLETNHQHDFLPFTAYSEKEGLVGWSVDLL